MMEQCPFGLAHAQAALALGMIESKVLEQREYALGIRRI